MFGVLLLGFLLGMSPFGEVEDIKSQDFSFEIKPSPVNVKLDPESVVKREDFVLDTVNLGVERQSKTKERFNFIPKKQIIVVTPTYNRALQAFYLNRLGQVLRLVPPPILWMVVEMNVASMETAEILRKTGVMYRHIVCTKNSTNVKDREFTKGTQLSSTLSTISLMGLYILQMMIISIPLSCLRV